MKLKDKVAIITGAGQGIGRAYALRFAQEGAKVVIADINHSNAQAVAKEIEGIGGEAMAIRIDVSQEEETQRMAKRTIERFGGIDVLINNAAIFFDIGMKPFSLITVEEWDRLFEVNVKGIWLCIRAVTPQMKEQGKGKIINISSGTWLAGIPMMLAYTTSKAAVVGLTRCISRELGEFNINVNCMIIGFTMTEASRTMPGTPLGMAEGIASFTAMGRNGVPGDVVGTAVFLASEDSDFITGQSINVDGGWVMH